MNARMIQVSLKPGQQKEFLKMLTERGTPLLQEQPGFIDAVGFTPENEKDQFIGITFWRNSADADKYNNGPGKQFIENVKPFAQTQPVLRSLDVTSSTIHSIEASRSVAAD